MTSSVDELSEENGYPDNGNADEQQKNSESQIHSPSPAIGISNLSIATTNMQYMTPSEVVAGKAMEQMAYPYPDPYYRSIFATHDVQPYPAQPYPTMPFPAQPMVHLQLMGIQQAGVPLPSDAVEEPVFVNAKQYHGILRRRQIRAKAESKKKIVKPQKPYLHESRHLHALRRERGSGGRFLKSKKNEDQQKDGDQTQANINTESNQNQIAPSEGAAH